MQQNCISQEENRNLNAKLVVFENKLALESKQLDNGPEDDFKICSQIVSTDGETESSRDGNIFSHKCQSWKSPETAESIASGENVFTRENNSEGLINENIESAEKQETSLAVPQQNSVSD